MTKLFKNSKNALAFVLAFAVLAVSLFTGVAINADAAGVTATYTAAEVIFRNNQDAPEDTSFITNGSHAGTVDDPYIISTVEHLLGLVRYSGNLTGKYIKVADGIKVISVQSEYSLRKGMDMSDNIAALNAFIGLEDVTALKNYFSTTPSKNKWKDAATPFNGTLDFNGATVVGLYSEHGGLLPAVGPNATIKNVAVKNSYITSGYTSGALVGRAEACTASNAGTVKIENVEVGNCYVVTTADNHYAGALLGRIYEHTTNIGLHINNCIVYGNEVYSTTNNRACLFGTMSNVDATDTTATTYFMMENTVAIGCIPYWTNTNSTAAKAGRPPHFTNVYTDKYAEFIVCPYYTNVSVFDSVESWAGHVNSITTDAITGNGAVEAMPALFEGENSAWMATSGYPIITALHTLEAVDNLDGTHSAKCDCGVSLSGEDHDWSNKDGVCVVCSSNCAHADVDFVEKTPADCSNPATGDNVCNDCGKTIDAGVTSGDSLGHDFTVEGEATNLYDCDNNQCQSIQMLCSVCGEPSPTPTITQHDVEGQDWQDLSNTATCTEAGELTQYKKCNVCEGYGAKQTVPAEATGHDFYEYEEKAPTCTYEGWNAHKECPNCGESFALDAADDSTDYLTYDEVYIQPKSDAHIWVEYEASEADCENDGYTEDHKYCSDCYLLVIDGTETDYVIDWNAFYEVKYDQDYNEIPIGIGALAQAEVAEVFEEMLAQYLEDNGIEMPEEPAEDADPDEWNAYHEALYGVDGIYSQVDWEVFNADYDPVVAQIWEEAYHQALLLAAATDEENPIDLFEEATGHTLKKVDEVAATYEKAGVKAHWACECGKLFADEKGETEVTAEELVIAKLVKEDDKANDKSEDTTTDTKTEGDKSTESPKTGDSVASVASVAALMGAAFVLIRKARK